MKFVALAAVAALVASPALAAEAQLAAVKGAVTVNGKAAAGALKAGDRIVAAKGSAKVRFADGCTVDLKANSMVTVGSKSPCASGAGVVSANSANAAQGWMRDATTGQIIGTVVVAGVVIWGASNVLDTDPDPISN